VVGEQPVKSSAVFPAQLTIQFSTHMTKMISLGAMLATLAWLFAPTEAHAGDQVRRAPPLLLGGGIQPQKAKVRLDPVLPRGSLREELSPLLMKSRRCSLSRPVCVASSRTEDRRIPRALALLSDAYEEHRFGAQLPSALASFEEPLTWRLGESLSPGKITASRIPSRGFDRARAHCEGGPTTKEGARLCVIRAGLAASAPATAPWLSAGMAAALTNERGSAPLVRSEVATALRRPEVGILSSTFETGHFRSEEKTEVSLLRSARFFSYIERRSEKKRGEAAWLTLALAATHTEWGRSRWDAEPDLTDVLAVTLSGSRNDYARFLDDFAADAYFDAKRWGTKIRPAWTLRGESLPRNVALPHPLEPSGSAYAKILLTEQQTSQTMAFRMHCEAPVSYVWSVTRLDSKGEEINRIAVTHRERGSDAATRVEPHEGTAALLIVGTNLGGVELLHPFDPDNGPHEAHACSLYAAAL